MPNVNILETEQLNCYGNIRRREEDNLARKMMDVVGPGNRIRGWPRWRWINNTREQGSKLGWTGSPSLPEISLDHRFAR